MFAEPCLVSEEPQLKRRRLCNKPAAASASNAAHGPSKFCRGDSGDVCCFGPHGSRARPNGPRCIFCDPAALNDAFASTTKSKNIIQRLRQFSPETQTKAIERIPLEWRPWCAARLQKYTICPGLEQEPCIFALTKKPQAARVNDCNCCLYCNLDLLAEKCNSARGLHLIKTGLSKMCLVSRRKVIEERLPAEAADACKTLLLNANILPHTGKRLRRTSDHDGVYSPEEIRAMHEEGRQSWEPLLHQRQTTNATFPDEAIAAYRRTVLADRSKALNMMHQPHDRVLRDADISNRCPLPPGKRSKLAADLDRWCRYDSWQVCASCGFLQPRELTPQSLERLQPPTCTEKACLQCKAKQNSIVPSIHMVPEELRNLSAEAKLALSPLELDFGPEVRAKDRFGRPAGYRQHVTMVTFSWHATSVKQRIDELQDREDRKKCLKALKWLIKSRESAYFEFYQEHTTFLEKHPEAEPRQRKRWLRFIERVGVECAAWPTLFWCKEQCLSWVREQMPSRQARRSKSTVERRLFPDEFADDAEEDNTAEDTDGYSSTKRAFGALALSPLLDYGSSYELLHFAFDLNLWTALGAKKNMQSGVPLRIMMKGHSFSPLYWRDMHLALIDLVRQKGFPPVFWTLSPFEWSFPYHEAIVDAMQKTQKSRMHLALLETLHQAHVMIQIGKHFVGGSNCQKERAKRRWNQQLFQIVDEEGHQEHMVDFLRLEFQDGTRKAPTQDYHGSGRAHMHALRFANNARSLRLEKCVSATIPADDSDLAGYLQTSQQDRDGKTPWPVAEGPNRWDIERQSYVFEHTPDDHAVGLRAYFPDVMDVTKCHEDIQVCYGDENYTSYTAKYGSKFSDSMNQDLLNDDADGNSVAASVLARYKPYEPEMVLQLFGAKFRQWQVTTKSGGRRMFHAPVPDQLEMPHEIRLYEQCTWKSSTMSLIDFLRKSNKEGNIAHWLKQLHKTAESHQDLHTFAQEYKMQGEQIVAVDMFSRLNDKFYGQWLVMNIPFSQIRDLIHPDAEKLVPTEDKYLAMFLLCPHRTAKQMWTSDDAIDFEMRLESTTAAHRKTVLARFHAHAALVADYLSGRLDKNTLLAEQRNTQTTKRQAHQLPMQEKYEQFIRNKSKDVEGRINSGKAARVMVGDILVLGRTKTLVAEIHIFNNFTDMIVHFGLERVLPDQQCISDAVQIYHSFRDYKELARQHGVRAFVLTEAPLQEVDNQPCVVIQHNQQQERYLKFLKEDIIRSMAVHNAMNEADADVAREETRSHNIKIRVLDGPPGTGKTTTVFDAIEFTIAQGGRVGFFCPTANLASRMRIKFGKRIDIDTCHAAFGFHENFATVAYALAPYALVIVDEFSQLNDEQMIHIDNLRRATDYAAAFALCGDKCQMAGFGGRRPWEAPLWKKATHTTSLVELYRCKDPAFKKQLAGLRTTKPLEHGATGISVADIMRGRRAWKGPVPTVTDIRRILLKHPNTTMLAVTRRGAGLLNSLALQAKYPKRSPVITLPGDVESNADNYEQGQMIRNVPQQLPIYVGMQIYLTRNINKDADYVNGMQGHVEAFDSKSQCVRVLTATGNRIAVYPWTDTDLNKVTYYPMRPGYASTILKFQGAELPHVTLYLDAANVPGAAYTAMSRVSYGRDLIIGGGVTKHHFTPAT
jgi:ASC-1-like (ASCH) protein/type II secretory pathway component PulJ